MAPPHKIEYIRKKKTYNKHYCQQCRIYYQRYNYRCVTLQYRDSSPTTSKGEEWINPNPKIVKLKSKSLMLKKFDSWLKLDPKGKWNADLAWDRPDDSKWY